MQREERSLANSLTPRRNCIPRSITYLLISPLCKERETFVIEITLPFSQEKDVSIDIGDDF